jgi:hypothetical protein
LKCSLFDLIRVNRTRGEHKQHCRPPAGME